MLEINACAGGQVFRTALALSAITLQPIKISNIRSDRPNPGLQLQHLTALETLGRLTQAEIKGNQKHSPTIEFSPKQILGENFTVNIGSAGSISLLLQSILLPAMFAEKKVSLKIFGGTNVEWSPPIEFFQEVLFPIVSQMGAKFELKLIKRGYYPKGKGIASFSSQKSFLPLKPLNLVSRGELDFIKIFSHCANLPKEVAVNQFSSAKKELQRLNVGIDSVIDCSEKSNTIGSGITIIGFFSDGAKISGSALGKKGIPAVKIGKEAAQIFLKEFDVGKPVDSHLADQLIPFMAIAKGTSKISTTFLTEHTLNNIETVKKFLPCEIKVNGKLNECAEIEVKGVGLK